MFFCTFLLINKLKVEEKEILLINRDLFQKNEISRLRIETRKKEKIIFYYYYFLFT